MLTTLKWLCAKPDKKWRIAAALFHLSWSWMTIMPVGLLLSAVLHGRDGDRPFFWTVFLTYVIAWGVGSLYVLSMFTHTTRLSERVDILEHALKSQAAEIPRLRDGISN